MRTSSSRAAGGTGDERTTEHPVPQSLGYGLADAAFLAGWHLRVWRMQAVRPRYEILHPESPILLLPGVYEYPHFLDPIGAVLRATGRPIRRVPTLGRNRARIVDTALAVRAFLETNDLRNVTIVAHSKGGLVGKQLMVWEETGWRIQTTVAIATPFSGSSYARFTPNAALRDFRPTDRTVRRLAVRSEVNDRIVSVYPRVDPQIPNGSRLEGARNIELPITGHFRVLGSPALHNLLREL